MGFVQKISLILGILLLVAGRSAWTVAAQAAAPVLTAPAKGDALQGSVNISGTSQVDGFASAELDFAYHDDPTGTWFPISTASQPVTDGVLGTWDTTAISDGTYDLRLRVLLTDGTAVDALVPNLRVRNYTPVESPTPTAVIPEATPLPTATSTPTPFPTPTLLPANPAVLSPVSVTTSLAVGGLVAMVLFAILGLYLRARRK
jgi:hypothetical protein